MTQTLVYIDILAIMILLFAGADRFLHWSILSDLGLVLVIFVAATLLLITTFLRLTVKKQHDE
ncbi:MAG TPA: hypothetical protein VLE47_01495 [Candidatus Saccharimonadales bacterium]|nr:hypothetical protein [Candidatus Saccharimonadales bacterium]